MPANVIKEMRKTTNAMETLNKQLMKASETQGYLAGLTEALDIVKNCSNRDNAEMAIYIAISRIKVGGISHPETGE